MSSELFAAVFAVLLLVYGLEYMERQGTWTFRRTYRDYVNARYAASFVLFGFLVLSFLILKPH